jgi:hypothetical protein
VMGITFEDDGTEKDEAVVNDCPRCGTKNGDLKSGFNQWYAFSPL